MAYHAEYNTYYIVYRKLIKRYNTEIRQCHKIIKLIRRHLERNGLFIWNQSFDIE